MTRREIKDKIAELQDLLEEMDKPIGYEDDVLFLLSSEEYERYKDKIRCIEMYWWLRDKYTNSSAYVCRVNTDGYSYYGGASRACGVRPCLKYDKIDSIIDSKEKNCFIWNETKWRIIDKENCIAISEVPIWFMEFDNQNNDYETSSIRKFLKEWSGLEY